MLIITREARKGLKLQASLDKQQTTLPPKKKTTPKNRKQAVNKWQFSFYRVLSPAPWKLFCIKTMFYVRVPGRNLSRLGKRKVCWPRPYLRGLWGLEDTSVRSGARVCGGSFCTHFNQTKTKKEILETFYSQVLGKLVASAQSLEKGTPRSC